MSEIKRITPKEFRDLGYLQDVNRRYFHPLGMALEVVIHEDGKVEFGGVWDYRDDPEGMAFGDDCWNREKVDVERSREIADDRERIAGVRQESLGYVIQPLPEE